MLNTAKYIIYQPVKTAMQSGKKQSQYWLLSKEHPYHRNINPLMGWTTSCDSATQVILKFTSKEKAIAFAIEKQYQFTVIDKYNKPSAGNELDGKFLKTMPKPKSYADNFLS